tara:strand:- start:1545 stop:2057 length:513 start_codon:yes stop_codon:yes gene_type:complete
MIKIAVVLFFVLPVLCGCWPSSFSFKDAGSMPEEWKSFSVEMIENSAPNCPLSYGAQITERLKDAIQNNTRLVLNTDNGGEIEISGNILDYSVAPIAIQQDDNASQNRLTIRINFQINVNEPENQIMPISVSRFADFESNVNLASVETQLIEEINDQITQDVINKLLSNW